MARHNNTKRAINGILLLDKPLGLSSNQALQTVKNLFQARKAGHTGSLDPLATGMLPLCFGEATKFSQYLLEANKAYRVIGRLGIKTTTADSEGQVVERVDKVEVERSTLCTVLDEFRGETEQVPSMFSALKHQGVPLYKLARQGIEVERKARKITIFELNLLNFDGVFVELDVVCSKGTYIRNLIEDIGERLGVGAHVVELRRLYCEPYAEAGLVSMEQLTELAESNPNGLLDCLLPIESILVKYPRVSLDASLSQAVMNGQTIEWADAKSGYVGLYAHDGSLLGLGEVLEAGRIAPKRLVKNTSIKKVLPQENAVFFNE